MDTSSSIFVLQVIGTVAFAVSGAVVGVRKRMDLLGVVIMALAVAVGGGIIRDVIIGITPPTAFRDPTYIALGALTGAVMFLPAVRNWLKARPIVYRQTFIVADAVGLGIFTASGIQTAYAAGNMTNVILLLFVGVATGTGGGVIRDIFANMSPTILTDDFYATAALIGAGCCLIAWAPLGETGSMLLCTSVVVILRLVAVRYHWRLPRPS